MSQSRFTDAYEEATMAVAGDGSEDSYSHSRRARALVGLNRYYEALEEFQQAEELDPENTELELGGAFGARPRCRIWWCRKELSLAWR